MDYDYSPTALKKVVYAGTQATSFPQGERDLKELAELEVSAERVRRATEADWRRTRGGARCSSRGLRSAADPRATHRARRSTDAGGGLRADGWRQAAILRPSGAATQRRRHVLARDESGLLVEHDQHVSAEDPCPRLPASFVDPERMQRMVREIKGFSGPEGSAEDDEEERIDERAGRPRPLARSVVASRQGVETFGKLLASEAHQRRFAAASRKAFVADGSDSNWGVWRRHFSDYVPILDFIHALRMSSRGAWPDDALKEGWRAYRQWAQWVWSGQVDRVIAALEVRQHELGEPTKETSKTVPSAIVARSLGYLQNQRSRMDYSEYRKQGLPMTSTYVESTVKQINRRMKGTEKFWSQGVEPMLTLVADHLSDTPTLARFWRNRPHRLTGCRGYQSHAA